ncbi:MAG TPA: hypothetical protein DCS97_11155 [Planctomycetes bacterium]|nr:hypothetical protein [Planctomycetota bacterium]
MQQKEIARQLGVSPAVVSMALRGVGRVSPELRTEILALAQRNQVGLRKLRKRIDAVQAPVRRIAYCALQHELVWPHIGTFSSLNEPLLGVSYEVSLVLAELRDKSARAALVADLVRKVAAMQLDGLVVGPHDDLAGQLTVLGLPLVQLEYKIASPARDLVVPDNFNGAYRLAGGLLAAGCRRIALVRCLCEDLNSIEKFAGFGAAFAQAGLAIDPALVVAGTCRYQEGERCAAALCAIPGPPPDAILLENDWHAPELVQHLRQHLPAHWPRLSAIRFGMFCDSERSNSLTTPPDRVLLPRPAMGHLAVRRVLERIASPSDWKPMVVRVVPEYRPGGG